MNQNTIQFLLLVVIVYGCKSFCVSKSFGLEKPQGFRKFLIVVPVIQLQRNLILYVTRPDDKIKIVRKPIQVHHR